MTQKNLFLNIFFLLRPSKFTTRILLRIFNLNIITWRIIA